MPELIIRTRISPPKPPAKIVHREKLVNILKENLYKNLIIISGPAGYGKTTLVQELIGGMDDKSAWLQVSNNMSDFYTFMTYLLNSLRRLNPEFGVNTAGFLESLRSELKYRPFPEDAVKDTAGIFINDLMKDFGSDVFLVIDDFHELNRPEWLAWLFGTTLASIPDLLHIIITSRQETEIELTALKAKRKLFELRSIDLTFSSREIQSLLTELYGIHAADEDIDSLRKSIGGWITGIHLLIQAYGKDFTSKRMTEKGVPDILFDFFADEIFTSLQKDLQNFLVSTAHLSNFDQSVCDHILGINESKNILEQLLNKNVFIEASEDPEKGSTFYNYQPSFKSFLISRSKDLLSEEELKGIYLRVYEYYLRKKDFVAAVEHALLAGEYGSALSLLKELFDRLFEEGKYETLIRWLDLFPGEFSASDPYLLYFRAQACKYYTGEYDKALNYALNSIEKLRALGEKQLLPKAQLLYSAIILDMGKHDEALEFLSSVNEEELPPDTRSKMLYLMGNAYFLKSRYEEAISVLNRALEICNENDLKEIRINIFDVMGNISLTRGDFIKSIYYYEQIVLKATTLLKKFVTLINISILYSRSGKFEKAKDYFDRAGEIAAPFTSPLFKLSIAECEYSLRFECGDYEGALSLAETINAIAKKTDNRSQIFLSYMFLAETSYYLGKKDSAFEYFNLAENFKEGSASSDNIYLDLYRATMEIGTSDDTETESRLNSAYLLTDSMNMFYDRSKVGYLLAKYYFYGNQTETSFKYLDESLRLSEEKEYISFLQREFFRARELFDFSISKGAHKEFIKNLALEIIDNSRLAWLSPKCRERLDSDLERMYDIKMTSFGELSFKVRGLEVREDKWIRKKRKLILAYLLLFPNSPLTKDRIIDLFFPDSPVDSVDNIFHQSVSNIRSALKPDIPSGPSGKKQKAGKIKRPDGTAAFPQFINYEDKVLRLNTDYIYSVDALEFNRFYNIAYSSESSPEKKLEYLLMAAKLCKGELLSGYYEPWCEELRIDYSNRFIKLCEDVIGLLSSHGKYEDVITYADRLIKADRLNEKAYISSIEASVRLNQVNRAREKFSKLLKTYKEELGEKPSEETLQKIKNLLP